MSRISAFDKMVTLSKSIMILTKWPPCQKSNINAHDRTVFKPATSLSVLRTTHRILKLAVGQLALIKNRKTTNYVDSLQQTDLPREENKKI